MQHTLNTLKLLKSLSRKPIHYFGSDLLEESNVLYPNYRELFNFCDNPSNLKQTTIHEVNHHANKLMLNSISDLRYICSSGEAAKSDYLLSSDADLAQKKRMATRRSRALARTEGRL